MVLVLCDVTLKEMKFFIQILYNFFLAFERIIVEHLTFYMFMISCDNTLSRVFAEGADGKNSSVQFS